MSFYSIELPYQADAAHYYAVLADLPWAMWLDSGGMARYDILTAVPQRTLMLNDEVTQSDPFAWVRSELGEQVAAVEDVPFAGGALGYWAYDLAKRMYSMPNVAEGAGRLPDMAIGIYDWALVLDHQKHTASLVSHQRFEETAKLLPKI
jgi:para-aminobenzoate synthetase component 1